MYTSRCTALPFSFLPRGLLNAGWRVRGGETGYDDFPLSLVLILQREAPYWGSTPQSSLSGISFQGWPYHRFLGFSFSVSYATDVKSILLEWWESHSTCIRTQPLCLGFLKSMFISVNGPEWNWGQSSYVWSQWITTSPMGTWDQATVTWPVLGAYDAAWILDATKKKKRKEKKNIS